MCSQLCWSYCVLYHVPQSPLTQKSLSFLKHSRSWLTSIHHPLHQSPGHPSVYYVSLAVSEISTCPPPTLVFPGGQWSSLGRSSSWRFMYPSAPTDPRTRKGAAPCRTLSHCPQTSFRGLAPRHSLTENRPQATTWETSRKSDESRTKSLIKVTDIDKWEPKGGWEAPDWALKALKAFTLSVALEPDSASLSYLLPQSSTSMLLYLPTGSSQDRKGLCAPREMRTGQRRDRMLPHFYHPVVPCPPPSPQNLWDHRIQSPGEAPHYDLRGSKIRAVGMLGKCVFPVQGAMHVENSAQRHLAGQSQLGGCVSILLPPPTISGPSTSSSLKVTAPDSNTLAPAPIIQSWQYGLSTQRPAGHEDPVTGPLPPASCLLPASWELV